MDYKNQNSAKKLKMLYRFKMAAKYPIFISRHSNFGQIWKTTFPKEFSNEIWLKVGEHEYIYITEITFFKNYFVLKWRPKQIFDIAQ